MDENHVRELSSENEPTITDWTKETEERVPKEFISDVEVEVEIEDDSH